MLTRCERGADIARTLGFNDDTVQAIRALDEHWDGAGQPYALEGEQIPLLARILGLAQTVEVFFSMYGADAACDMATARKGSWFDPDLVDALLAFRSHGEFWRALAKEDGASQLAEVEPADKVLVADEDRLDRVAEAFALVIDAKSPWTFQHSRGVAATSVAIAKVMGYPAEQVREIRRAALLHDIGKLGVSSLILDKPGQLTDEEFQVMRTHPIATREILSRTGCFRHLANAAASHHERLDGTGYDLGLGRSELPMLTRVLCTSDVCDALRASRPYRSGMPVERVLEIMGREVGTGIDPTCFEALQIALGDGDAESAAGYGSARGETGVGARRKTTVRRLSEPRPSRRAHTRDTASPAAPGTSQTADPRTTACTDRTSSRARSSPPGRARTLRTVPPPSRIAGHGRRRRKRSSVPRYGVTSPATMVTSKLAVRYPASRTSM